MSRIFEGISAYMRDRFDAEDWEEDDEGDKTLAFLLEDDQDNEWDCAVLVDDRDERLVFYSTMLEPVAPDYRPAVMEFVTRANFALPVGNFELDLEDGEICFKTSLDLEGVELHDSMSRNLIDTNLMVMGVYFEALQSVMHGKAEPVEAIAAVEDEQDEED
ncbi:MAG: YbjN domain-containing protein [Nannocystaceae bacterium]